MGLTKGKIIGIIIIVIILISVVIFYAIVNDQEVTGITILTAESSPEDGLKIDAIVESSGEINDNANLRIDYDGSQVYSRSVNIVDNSIKTTIPWKDFAIGNKEYTMRISYDKESAEDEFYLTDHDWAVCEKVLVAAQLSPGQYDVSDPNIQPKLKITLRFVDEEERNLQANANDLDVTLSIQYENNAPITHSTSIDYEDLLNNDYSYEYDYSTGGGNYTIIATVENKFVNSDSKYAEITSDELQEMYNLIPLALVDPSTDDGDIIGYEIQIRNNGEVTFDASGSKNDGEIESYEWDFDYNIDDWEFTVDATGEEVTHSFSGRGMTYYIALRVKGDAFVEDPFAPEKGLQREYATNVDWEVFVKRVG